MGFKEDADFARFVSMGAVATDAVRKDLKRLGHEAIELERYAMANKVKRLRLPDLVCVRCGLRVESRGKTKLSIVLSHSDADGRSWDGGGMREDDVYAFLRVDATASPPRASTPAYFRTAHLRTSAGTAKVGGRKARSEGSELTLTWPSWVPSSAGQFLGVDSQGRLTCVWETGRSSTYWQWREWPTRYTYLASGDPIVANESIVAGVVAPPGDLTCPGGWDLEIALSDVDPAERYAAAKTAGVLGRSDLRSDLVGLAHGDEDWRLRLEATAGLARLDAHWIEPVLEIAMSPTNTTEHRIESVLVLSEIATDGAAEALADVAALGGETPREVRAAAVWGLARGVHPRPDLVLRFAVDEDDLVALHAVAGLPFLPDECVSEVLDWLSQDDRRAAVAAQLLLRQDAVRPLLDAVGRGGRGRLWALRALGDLSPELIRARGHDLLTPEIEKDLEPLWVAGDDWLRRTGADGLAALDVQKVRFSPILQ